MNENESKEYRQAVKIADRCRAKGLRVPTWYRNIANRYERLYPVETQKILDGIKKAD